MDRRETGESAVYKIALCVVTLIGCSPHIVPVDETPVDVAKRSDMSQVTGMTQIADMSSTIDASTCAAGYMRCVENEQAVCVPERCGGCFGVICSPNQPDCCGETCTNLRTYANNCGVCGNVCRPGAWCADGVCVTKE